MDGYYRYAECGYDFGCPTCKGGIQGPEDHNLRDGRIGYQRVTWQEEIREVPTCPDCNSVIELIGVGPAH